MTIDLFGREEGAGYHSILHMIERDPLENFERLVLLRFI